MLQHQKVRLPRFRPDPDRVRAAKITARDYQILEAIYRHRFLRSSHIVGLVEGSGQQILRRLHRLFHHGYVTRPRCQLDFFHAAGSTPMVYGISNKGARVLPAHVPGLDPKHSRTDWTAKNNSVQQIYLHHALLVSDIMVAMEIAFRNHPSVQFIPLERLFPHRARPITWRVESRSRKSSGIYPDAVFALEALNASGELKRCHYFVEADTGSMPIERKPSSKASSFAGKLELYSETWRQKLHRTELGIQRFQLLTVTISPKRAKQIAAVAGKIWHGPGIFLFTDLAAISKSAGCGSIFHHRWFTAHSGAEDTLKNCLAAG